MYVCSYVCEYICVYIYIYIYIYIYTHTHTHTLTSFIDMTQKSDGEASLMLGLWGMRSTPSLYRSQGPISGSNRTV